MYHRAGSLLLLFHSFIFYVALAAPIAHTKNLAVRNLSYLTDSDYTPHSLSTRDIPEPPWSESETQTLVRRAKVNPKVKAAFAAVKHGFQKVGKQIAKVGLMIGAAVTSVASKVIGLVPGVGKAAGMALKGAAKGLTKASDAIHAPLGKGLTKAMSGMHTAANPPGLGNVL